MGNMCHVGQTKGAVRRPQGVSAIIMFRGTVALALVATSCAEQLPQAQVLQCHAHYADTLQTFTVSVASNPYTVPNVPIHGRFEFRAVYVTEPTDLAVLNIYVYQTSTPHPALVHQLKLHPPYHVNGDNRFGITGLNLVYDERARELQYWCGFANDKDAH